MGVPVKQILANRQAKLSADQQAALEKQDVYDHAHGQRLWTPPAGGPMSMGPPQGQPMRGPTMQMPSQMTPNTLNHMGSTGGRQYTPNPFQGKIPNMGLQSPGNPGMLPPAGAQPPVPPTRPQIPQPVMGGQMQAQIAALRGGVR